MNLKCTLVHAKGFFLGGGELWVFALLAVGCSPAQSEHQLTETKDGKGIM
jgi:hypothetical protein